MRVGARLAFAFAVAMPAAAAWADELLQHLETDDLRLVWFHPTEDYLAPHVARSFENSMQFQKSLWGWQPDGKVTVLLKDFIDYGNAGATSVPSNLILIDIAPVPYTLETFVANERM